MRIALDTSVIVAGLSPWHALHDGARAALDDSLSPPARALLPVPALVEAFSVLTRVPAAIRLGPDDACELLRQSLMERTELVALERAKVWTWLEERATEAVSGGAIYDALILACARKAKAQRILTLNRRDFLRLGAQEMGIEVPEI